MQTQNPFQLWWTYLLSFLLYLLFVVFFSSYLWLMYSRYEEDLKLRIPVRFPVECSKSLVPILGEQSEKRAGGAVNFIDDEQFQFEFEVVKTKVKLKFAL